MRRSTSRPPRLIEVAAFVLLCGACKPEDGERAQEAVDEVARRAEKGVVEARAQAREGLDQAREGIDEAREGLADTRERLEVDARVAEARDRFSRGLDEAAASFSALADAGRDKAEDIGAAIDEQRQAGIEGAAEAIRCEPDPTQEQTRRCKIGKELLAKLEAEPKLLAREVMLLPKQGETGHGLQLVRMRSEGIPDLLGLDRNDILLELNGTSLGSLDAIRTVDEALRDKPEAEIVFERDGERRKLIILRERAQ